MFARLNAFAFRNLRNEWLFKSSLSRDIKDRVRKSPLCNGELPQDRSIECVAPIVGPSLQSELDMEYTVSKKSEQIKKKAQSFKRPSSQSAPSSQPRGGGARQGKRPRYQDTDQQAQQQNKHRSNYNQNRGRPNLRFNTSNRGRGRGAGRGAGGANNRQQKKKQTP